MFRVELDASAFRKALGAQAEQELEGVIDALQEVALDEINLHSEKLDAKQQRDYRNALNVKREKLSVTITLEDPRIERLEEGFDSFDMKPKLLASASAGITNDGDPYIDIPFKHAMTKRGAREIGASQVPTSMAGAVRKAIRKSAETGGRVRMGRRTKHANLRDMLVRASGGKGSESADLRTIRRISKNSDPTSWVHPGHKGFDIFPQVTKKLEHIKDKMTADILGGP